MLQQQGRSARGKAAKAVAGAEAIEIEATVPDHQVEQALAQFGLTANNDQERLIDFVDTPALELPAAGIVARARRIVGDAHDRTVRFRPVQPPQIGAQWRKDRGFKIEVDASEKAMARSAPFSMPVDEGVIEHVAGGRRTNAALFSAEQEEFLMTMAGRRIEFGALAVLGPLQAQRWQVEDPACLAEDGAERDVNERTKTRWAQDHHAARPSGAARTRSKP